MLFYVIYCYVMLRHPFFDYSPLHVMLIKNNIYNANVFFYINQKKKVPKYLMIKEYLCWCRCWCLVVIFGQTKLLAKPCSNGNLSHYITVRHYITLSGSEANKVLALVLWSTVCDNTTRRFVFVMLFCIMCRASYSPAQLFHGSNRCWHGLLNFGFE